MEKYFKNFKKYAFRLELLQKYDVSFEEENYNNFLETGKVNHESNKEWHDIIKDAKQRGAEMSRVHVIKKPLSDYLKFEFEMYKGNQKAGEEILILKEEYFKSLDVDIYFDFWLFDDEVVLKMEYNKYGKYLAYQKLSNNIDKFISLKNKLLNISKKF